MVDLFSYLEKTNWRNKFDSSLERGNPDSISCGREALPQ
jgi:hypothetical protein